MEFNKSLKVANSGCLESLICYQNITDKKTHFSISFGSFETKSLGIMLLRSNEQFVVHICFTEWFILNLRIEKIRTGNEISLQLAQ